MKIELNVTQDNIDQANYGAMRCPIAKAFNDRGLLVRVSYDFITFLDDDYQKIFMIATPDVFHNFMYAFDRHETRDSVQPVVFEFDIPEGIMPHDTGNKDTKSN